MEVNENLKKYTKYYRKAAAAKQNQQKIKHWFYKQLSKHYNNLYIKDFLKR